MSLLRSLLPGAASCAVLLLIFGSAFAGLISAAGRVDLAAAIGDPYVRAVLRFSLWQALLSAVLSVGLAVPVARALARRPAFPGRALLLRLLGLPMVVPTIVSVLGIVAIYGRSGLVNRVLEGAGIDARLDIYGLTGILIAHVFLNMPFAVRVLLQGWAGIPAETWRLAGQLGLSGADSFRLIEWPMLRQIMPGVAGLVFLLCFTSFAVVLVLGGGPPNATIEVALYQALRFDFDLGRVAAFAMLQILIAGILVSLWGRLARSMPAGFDLGRPVRRYDGLGIRSRVGDAVAILFGVAVLTLPLAAIVAAGLEGPMTRVLGDGALWRAAGRSVAIGFGAGMLSLALGWGVVQTARDLRVRLHRPRLAGAVEGAGALVLVVPPLVIGAGLFVLLSRFADVFSLTLGLVVVINACMGLPFVVRILGPASVRVAERQDRLCQSLDIAGWNRFRLVEWPLLRRPAALALALCAALAMGDLGVIALFGSPTTATLPFYLFQKMGSYQTDDAAVAALILVGFCLALFVIIERGLGGRADR